MATETVAGSAALGTYSTGELVGAGPGRAYGQGDARRQPYVATLLVGRNTVDVEYPDAASLMAAVNGAGVDLRPGEDGRSLVPQSGDRPVVTLRVFPRIGGPREAKDRCFVVYAGPRVNADERTA